MRRHGTSQEGFDAEWRDDQHLRRSTATWSTAASYSTRQTSTPRSRGSKSSAGRHRGWKTRQAKCTSASWRASRPATGPPWPRSLADDISRRRSPSGGERRGPTGSGCRDREHASRSPTSGSRDADVDVIATRGERLALSRVRFSGRDQQPEAFQHRGAQRRRDRRRRADRRASSRSTSTTSTPPSTELDARYLAGEAAAHARTWSVIAGGYAALNRHELPPTTPDCVNIDHRRGQLRAR